MSLKLLRRKYRVLLLILVTGSIYLCFQLFSLKVLNFSSQHDLKIQMKHSGKILDIIDESLNIADKESELKNQDSKLKFQHGANNEHEKILSGNPAPKVVSGVELVLGTLVSQSEDYKPSSDGKFQCLQSKEFIPFPSVNDDYCDCSDSSDEPGSSACPDSRFYCTFQNPDIAAQFVLGSRVNDGVCDCCDGSDEWSGVSVFSGVHLTDKKFKDTLTHTPCPNECKAILDQSKEDGRIREMGKRLKRTYLEKGREISKPDLYGPDSVFYKLSFSCYEFDTAEYKYRLCPFQSVTQQKFPGAATDLGKTPVWRARLPGHCELKMDKGDPSRCPFGKFRNTVILFICGLTDKIVSVKEDEKCSYSMKFSTPAAC